MTIHHENMIVESKLPISQVLNLEMHHQLNHHGTLTMNLVINPEAQGDVLQTNYQGQTIQLLNQQEPTSVLIFSGKIQRMTYKKQNQLLTASLEAISYSIELDEALKTRSFQNPNLTFEKLLEGLTNGHARFSWEVGKDKPLGKPFIQYEETDWQFIKRLASYFESPVQPHLLSLQPDFYFGIRQGERQTLDEAVILEIGVSDHYYQNGGYEQGRSRKHDRYLKVKQRTPWQIGDFVWHQSQKLTVIEQLAIFEKGELLFINTLGAAGFLHQKTMYSNQLRGLNLQGIIRRVEKESLTIQLDMDQEEQAHYLWPWVPEVGNLNYMMPEVGSKVVLTLPTHDEKDGMATHLLRTNSNHDVYSNVANRQIVTQPQKTMGLYPDQILLAGKENGVTLSLEDQTGVHLRSNQSIRLRAQDQIQLKGQTVTLKAPEQLLLQTADSNIEVAKNFNFYAPEGVNTDSARPSQSPQEIKPPQTDDPNHWPLSYGALGAMPCLSLEQLDPDAVVDLASKGAMPSLATAQSALAMSDVMQGEKAEETAHASAFSSLGSFTLKGGSRIPKEE